METSLKVLSRSRQNPKPIWNVGYSPLFPTPTWLDRERFFRGRNSNTTNENWPLLPSNACTKPLNAVRQLGFVCRVLPPQFSFSGLSIKKANQKTNPKSNLRHRNLGVLLGTLAYVGIPANRFFFFFFALATSTYCSLYYTPTLILLLFSFMCVYNSPLLFCLSLLHFSLLLLFFLLLLLFSYFSSLLCSIFFFFVLSASPLLPSPAEKRSGRHYSKSDFAHWENERRRGDVRDFESTYM